MLTAGTRIGTYEIVSSLGEGGMGEVYRARDTRLQREVAIKILPSSFAADPDRRARFEREAQVLATLNHHNIAQVHGFEESVPSQGSEQARVSALVMELVEGPTLADRISAGPLPIEDALPIARQIAEALEAAHAQGIVHRDLKPANVKVRPDGTVKVLDFGLAKVFAPAEAGALMAREGPGSNSPPTITSPAMTAAGIILGTAAYMAPEQARGTAVDARADVWAFGAVLFEMISGKRAFEGELTSDVLASVLKSDPQWHALPNETSSALRRLIHRCLQKDLRRRLQAIGDARIEIEDLMTGAVHSAPGIAAASAPLRSRAVPWAVAAGMFALAALMLWLWSPWRAASPRASVRVQADLGVDAALVTANTGASAILSPDGSVLVFIGRVPGTTGSQLFVRRLSELEAIPLSGTDGAVNPFFSPDGQWIGFFSADKLKKISMTGGAVVTVGDAPNSRGGTWTADGTVIFAENRSGLWRVAASGGAREPLTTLAEGEVTHRHPQILPGGQLLLYTAHTAPESFDDAYLVVRSLATGVQSVVHRGGYFGRYLPTGHLMYVREGTLFAAPFDLDRLVTTAAATPVLQNLSVNEGRGEAQFAFSGAGTLVYFGQPKQSDAVPIAWLDRRGESSVLRSRPANWTDLFFAPDGRRLVMTILDGRQADIWIQDWERDVLSRVTLDAAPDTYPVWSPDGRGIAFSSARGGSNAPSIFWQRTDGSGEAQRLTQANARQEPSSWHPSGRFLAFSEFPLKAAGDVMVLPLDGNVDSGFKAGTPFPIANTRVLEQNGRFSPDGRWVAYESLETGISQVYVRPFQRSGERVQISTQGGELPRWSSKRQELLFHNLDNQIMAVSYTVTGDSFSAGRPHAWADVRMATLARGFDVHPDGERLAVPPIVPDDAARRDAVVLIFNFFDELRRATHK